MFWAMFPSIIRSTWVYLQYLVVSTQVAAGWCQDTQRRTTVGRTPLDEWSARRRDLYLTTHDTHSRQTSMPPVGFEPTISAGERPQTYALDRAATGAGNIYIYIYICVCVCIHTHTHTLSHTHTHTHTLHTCVCVCVCVLQMICEQRLPFIRS